jgi:hypothetical protein
MSAAALLLRRAPLISWLRIPVRLLIIAARLLFKTTLLWPALLRLTRLLLVTTLLRPALLVSRLRPILVAECTVIVVALIVVPLIQLPVTNRFLMLLELRPALRSAVVIEPLGPIVALVSMETQGPVGSDHLRTSAVVARVEVAVVPRSFHVVHLH